MTTQELQQEPVNKVLPRHSRPSVSDVSADYARCRSTPGWKVNPMRPLSPVGNFFQIEFIRGSDDDAADACRQAADELAKEFRATAIGKKLIRAREELAAADKEIADAAQALQEARASYGQALDRKLSGKAGSDDDLSVESEGVGMLEDELKSSQSRRDRVLGMIREIYVEAEQTLSEAISARSQENARRKKEVEVETRQKLDDAVKAILTPMTRADRVMQGFGGVTGNSFRYSLLGEYPGRPIGD